MVRSTGDESGAKNTVSLEMCADERNDMVSEIYEDT